jgi:hypothetical protein
MQPSWSSDLLMRFQRGRQRQPFNLVAYSETTTSSGTVSTFSAV